MQQGKTAAGGPDIEYRAKITIAARTSHAIEGGTGKNKGSVWIISIVKAAGKFVQQGKTCAFSPQLEYCALFTVAAPSGHAIKGGAGNKQGSLRPCPIIISKLMQQAEPLPSISILNMVP